MSSRILLIAAVLFLPAISRTAGDNSLDRATLKGLKAVSVVIDVIDPDLHKLGVTREALIGRLLARLQSDHITIDPGATEFLGLRITAVHNNRGPYALSLTIGLYQPVILSRNKEVRTSTQTWEVEDILLAEPKGLVDACADTADDLADRFAAAFHSVNPQ